MLPLVGTGAAWFAARRFDGAGWERWLGSRPRATIASAAVILALLFTGLLTARYLTRRSFILDLGSYDQKAWLIAIRPDTGAMLEQT